MSEEFCETLSDGTRYWYDDQKRYHRDGDLPAVEWADGTKVWYKHGELHRENGPAYFNPNNGEEEWHQNGAWHRTDGPAQIWPTDNICQWWFRGEKMDPLEVFLAVGKHNAQK